MPMSLLQKSRKVGIASLLVVAIFILLSAQSWAALNTVVGTRSLYLTVGKSIVLKSEQPIKRISEPNSETAIAVVISRREICITGRSAGTTNLIVWKEKDGPIVYNLEVSYDMASLKEKLSAVLPGEENIKVIQTQDSITLSGMVSSSSGLTRALALANAYAPGGKVRNLLEVGGVHQVMLEVRVAEMSKQIGKKLGINFNYARGGEFGVSTLGGLSQLSSSSSADLLSGPAVFNPNLYSQGPLGFIVSPTVNAFFRFHKESATWTGLIDALREDGLIKVLAEPTLIALSGKEARFLVGGEYPIPVPQGDGNITIDYKEFGVRLTFTPTVLSKDKIGIDVAPEVSELDFSAAFQYSGYVVPGLTTRKASTRVELADGQSFAIAGLLSNNVRENISKFPFLGDIPVLGALFRSESFIKDETELIIVVTPHLVKPYDAEKIQLPTDSFIEPNSMEFYLEGLLEGRGWKNPLWKGKFKGDFGHAEPESE
jgi:pilus assembly protein CpaC